MKKLVILICGVVLAVMLILIAYTLHGRNIRQTELENAMTSSMEKAMEMLQAERGYAPRDNEEFIAVFMQALAVQIDSSSDLTVNILSADYEKGLLSAEGILRFKHPIGTEGTVSCTKTIVRDTVVQDETEQVTIRFMAEGSVFKAYTLQKGMTCKDPGIPVTDGKRFVGWKNADGLSIDLNGLTAEEDMDYFAEFQ